MTRYQRWFFLVVWLGILANWVFAGCVLFGDSAALLTWLGLGPVDSTVWVFNYAVLLALLSCFYVPAAWDPFRYRANAWLLVVGRLVPAATFFLGAGLGFMPRGFLTLATGDASIGLVELFLLRRVLRAGQEASVRVGSTSGDTAAPTTGGSPVRRGRWLRRVAALLVATTGIVGFATWFHLFREVPTRYESDVDHFRYGSVGVEAANGLPYWIWYVLPDVFPDKMRPGRDGSPRDVQAAYQSFGFIWEDGRDAPIGLPTMVVGFPRIGVNCALCHTGTMRRAPDAAEEILDGAPTNRLDLQRYLRFLFACADDPRFSADELIPAIERVHRLSPIERFIYRWLIVPRTRAALQRQRAHLGWMDAAPDWGPGRSDPFNPAKFQLLGLPADGTVGNSDAMPFWNLARRAPLGLHWDGLNTSLDEIFLNSAIGNGATNRTIDRPAVARLQRWASSLPAARYPFPVKRRLAERGASVFKRACASCHAPAGEKFGDSIVLADPDQRTDGSRLASWSEATADRFNGLSAYDWQYARFRRSGGYVAVGLDGIWARAPYLHNGSVPTLAALLEPPASRPTEFYRGYDVYDPEAVGFVSSGHSAEREGTRFDTGLVGNDNAGHLWGTELSRTKKRAVLEYLKQQPTGRET